MRRFFIQKNNLLALLSIVLLSIASLVYLFTAGYNFIHKSASSTSLTPTSSLPQLPLTATSRPSPTGTACHLKGRDFQMGVVFPQWNPTGYGQSDTKWLTGIQNIRPQSGACWIEIPILFYQKSLTSTTVTTGPSTPTIASLTYGIQVAHALGYHVFVTNLLTVSGPVAWSGQISFQTFQQEQQWFDSYWQTIQPYVTAAAQAGAEQLAIGTEYEWLQQFAPDILWNELIAHLRSVFPGTLTYDMNWTSLQDSPRTWMRNSNLKMIGVSAYLPVIDTPSRIAPEQMPPLWKNRVQRALDLFAIELGKPIFISEIGYRDSADALYHSWETSSSAPTDPEEQAAACDAALVNVIPDPHIFGIFFWGWDDVGQFRLSGQPAVTVLHTRFTALQT